MAFLGRMAELLGMERSEDDGGPRAFAKTCRV